MAKYLLALISISLTAVAQLLLKAGVTSAVPAAATPLSKVALKVALNPFILGGLAVYGIGTVIWLAAISKLKLSVAYPMVSLSYILVMLGSAYFLGERISGG